MTSTRISRHINAPRDAVYQALLDADAIATWMIPDGMTSHVHRFEACEGGVFRISLTHDEPSAAGRKRPQTDTFHGLFVKLVPDEQVVQLVEFETIDPAMSGEMMVTITLADSARGGTNLHATHDPLPPGLAKKHNDAGWRKALGKLCDLVERILHHA